MEYIISFLIIALLILISIFIIMAYKTLKSIEEFNALFCEMLDKIDDTVFKTYLGVWVTHHKNGINLEKVSKLYNNQLDKTFNDEGDDDYYGSDE